MLAKSERPHGRHVYVDFDDLAGAYPSGLERTAIAEHVKSELNTGSGVVPQSDDGLKALVAASEIVSHLSAVDATLQRHNAVVVSDRADARVANLGWSSGYCWKIHEPHRHP